MSVYTFLALALAKLELGPSTDRPTALLLFGKCGGRRLATVAILSMPAATCDHIPCFVYICVLCYVYSSDVGTMHRTHNRGLLTFDEVLDIILIVYVYYYWLLFLLSFLFYFFLSRLRNNF